MILRSENEPPEVKVLVVNQHGDNRGDEAAMRSMVRSLADRLPGSSFTVVHQFSDPLSEVELGPPVEYLNLRLPINVGLRLGVFGLLTWLRVPGRRLLLGGRSESLVRMYEDAALVISAPGGPYFGDIYADHELVHWFYVWLAKLLNKPLFLYAPSVGPFHNRLLNVARRRGFTWFDALTVRDPESSRHLRELMGDGFRFELAADSALQTSEATGSRESGSDHFRLVVAVRDPGGDMSQPHDEAILMAIEKVCQLGPTEVVFLPQVHGPRHNDQPYLEALAGRITSSEMVRVEDGSLLTSDEHRRVTSSANLVIAGRYHPAVFAVATATPVVVIAYEHKSWGLARAAGIERWALDVTEASGDQVATRVLDAISRSDEIRSILLSSRLELIGAASRSTDLAIEMIRG